MKRGSRASHSFGIKTAKFQRCMRNDDLALRLYRLKDLFALYASFTPEVFLRASGVERAFRSFVSFWKWIITTFQMGYIIEVGGNGGRRVVGFVGLYNLSIGRSLWLSLAVFDPEDRRQGYGLQALELLLYSLHKEGIVETVYVEVFDTNVPSLRFFQKLGFEVRRRYEDRLLLEKSLENRPFIAISSYGKKLA